MSRNATIRNAKTTAVIAGLLCLGLGLSACSNTDPTPKSSGEETSSSKVTTIEVATATTAKPFAYVNENNEPTGYDIDVLKAIDKVLPEVTIDINPVPFASMFLGVDAGKYQVVATNIVKTPEREQKYDFSDESYFTTHNVIVYKKDRVGKVSSLKDLAGKTVPTFSSGNSIQKIVEGYNNDNPNAKINLIYGDFNTSDLLAMVENGQADATVSDAWNAKEYIDQQAHDLSTVVIPESEQEGAANKAYLLYGRDEKSQKAKRLLDKGLKTIIEDGTLSQISKDDFGDDYTGH